MSCTSCGAANREGADACFTCGKALHALTRGSVLASRYVVRQPIGRGGMGHVYRAYDRMLEEDVAIKVIRAEFMQEPEMARRFRSEIRLARKVSHPNVCRIHEYGEDGAVRYLSMEFVEGVDLKALLRGGPLPPPEGFEAAIQAADGLGAVHAHGIVHRDLKPSNLMVDRSGRLRLMDFGIAKEAEAESGLTGTGQMMGTPEYMSPEQAQRGKVGCASDVYALGCVIYEMFAGSPPFRADTPWNTLHMHLHDPPPLGSLAKRPLPAAIEPVLERAMAKDPSERCTASGLAAALREARAEAAIAIGELAPAVAAMGAESAPAEPEVTPGTALHSAPQVGHPPSDPIVTTTLGTLQPAPEPVPRGGSPGSSRRRWALPALAAAALLVVASSFRPRAAVDVPSEPGPANRAVAVEPAPAPSVPAPLPRITSAAPPATTPREVRRPGTRPPAIEPEQPGVSPSASGAPNATPSPPVRAASVPEVGTLSLLIVPAAEVTLDGASLGTLSIREVPLPPGLHVVRILHPEFKPLQRRVTIQSGLTERVVLDLSEKGILK